MKQYQMSLIKGIKLVSTTKFLENTSKMIKFFPLSPACGQHVKWKYNWNQKCVSLVSGVDDGNFCHWCSGKAERKNVTSPKCLDDSLIAACILVFLHVCLIQTTRSKGKGITPSRLYIFSFAISLQICQSQLEMFSYPLNFNIISFFF